jgi:NADH dehydrogenase FAD-containing subunit
MEPIRKYCRRSDAEQVRFIEAEATSIDPVTNKVHCTDNSLVKGSGILIGRIIIETYINVTFIC